MFYLPGMPQPVLLFGKFLRSSARPQDDANFPLPILRKNIALCRMAVEYSEIGTEIEVGKLDGHSKRIPAQVVRFPFYDPDKTRPRS